MLPQGTINSVNCSLRVALSNAADTLFADSLIEVTHMILCKASADCSDGSQVFEARKASAKEASANLEQVLCVSCHTSLIPQLLMNLSSVTDAATPIFHSLVELAALARQRPVCHMFTKRSNVTFRFCSDIDGCVSRGCQFYPDDKR